MRSKEFTIRLSKRNISDGRGVDKAAFTKQEEKHIAKNIAETFVLSEYGIQDAEVSMIRIDKYYTKHKKALSSRKRTPKTDVRHFSASKGMVYAFKKRHGFISKRPSYKRNPPGVDLKVLHEWEEQFCRDTREWLQRVGPSQFFFFDETSWKIVRE